MKKILTLLLFALSIYAFCANNIPIRSYTKKDIDWIKYERFKKNYFIDNWTLTGAKVREGNGLAFSSKSIAQLSAFNGTGDSILFQVSRTLQRPVFRYNVADTFSTIAYLGDITSGTVANAGNADSLGHLAAIEYELSYQKQGGNGIALIPTTLPIRNILWKLSNINPIALTGTGTIAVSAAIQATDLTATGHVATVGLTVTGGAQISAPLTVTGALSLPGTSSQYVKGDGTYGLTSGITGSSPFTGTSNITTTAINANLSVTGVTTLTALSAINGITTNTLDASGNLTASTGFFATTGSGNVVSGSNTDILGSGTFLRGGSNRDKSPLNVWGYNGDSIINATLGGIYLFKNVVLSGSISGSGLSLTGIVQYSDTSSMLSPYARTTNLINSPFQGTVNITPVTSGATLSLTGNITGAAVTGSSINSTGLVQGTSLRMLNGGVGGTDRTIIVGNVLSSGNITTFGPSRNNDTLITRGDLNNTINSGSFTGTNNITSTISAANVTLGGTLKFKKGGGIVALSDPTGTNTNYTSILIQNDGASSILGVESNSAGGTIINSDAYGSLIGAANAGQPLDLIAGDTVWAKLSSGKLTVIGNVSAGGITVSGEIKSASISTTTVRSVSVLSSTVNIDATYPFNQDGIVLLGQPSSGQINAIGSNTGTNRLTYDQTPARLNVTNLAVTGTITSNGLSVAGIINAAGLTATGAVQANSFSGTLITIAPAVSQAGFDMRNGSTVLQLYPNSIILSPINASFKTTVSLDNLTSGSGVKVAGIKRNISIDTAAISILDNTSGTPHFQTINTNTLSADISNNLPTVSGEIATGVKYSGTTVVTQQSGGTISTTGTIIANTLSATVTVLTNNFSSTGLAQFNNLQASGSIAGLLSSPNQSNISTVGILTGLLVSGNISATGNITSGTLSATGGISGTLTTAAQSNITSVGTLSSLIVSGTASAATLSGATLNANNINVAANGTITLAASTNALIYNNGSGFAVTDGSGVNGFRTNIVTSIFTVLGLGTGAVQATAGVLSVISSSQFKNDLGYFKGSAIGAIMKIDRGHYYTWNKRSQLPQNVKMFGLFADKVYNVLGEEFAPTQKDGLHSLADRALLSLTIQGMQEQQKQIDTQNNIIRLLESRLSTLENKLKK